MARDARGGCVSLPISLSNSLGPTRSARLARPVLTRRVSLGLSLSTLEHIMSTHERESHEWNRVKAYQASQAAKPRNRNKEFVSGLQHGHTTLESTQSRPPDPMDTLSNVLFRTSSIHATAKADGDPLFNTLDEMRTTAAQELNRLVQQFAVKQQRASEFATQVAPGPFISHHVWATKAATAGPAERAESTAARAQTIRTNDARPTYPNATEW